ncbi:MAG: SMC-Scp complex subunit ScpB [Propionibacteriaceae bacterium]|jgi:segregation and condensation protein B|nr:SMC-Scp complex subunit ScpB [Propionibacteriaceae bacterium]
MNEVQPIDAEIEALLILATEPLTEMELAETLEASVGEVTWALKRLAAFYDETGRGFELRHVGGGWRYYTRPEHADTIARSVLEGQHGRLSQASLETLAVIAYLQPVSRSRISAVRGVNVDGVVRTLITRNMVCEVDKDEASGAGLLGTTTYFLERMGLGSLEDLPPLAPHLPDASHLDEELRRLATMPQIPDLGVSDETADGQASNENADHKEMDNE